MSEPTLKTTPETRVRMRTDLMGMTHQQKRDLLDDADIAARLQQENTRLQTAHMKAIDLLVGEHPDISTLIEACHYANREQARLEKENTRLQAERAALIETFSYMMESEGWTFDVNNTRIHYMPALYQRGEPCWRVNGTDYPTAELAIESALNTNKAE